MAWGPLGTAFSRLCPQSMQNSRLRDDPRKLCGIGLPTCAQVLKQNMVAAGAQSLTACVHLPLLVRSPVCRHDKVICNFPQRDFWPGTQDRLPGCAATPPESSTSSIAKRRRTSPGRSEAQNVLQLPTGGPVAGVFICPPVLPCPARYASRAAPYSAANVTARTKLR